MTFNINISNKNTDTSLDKNSMCWIEERKLQFAILEWSLWTLFLFEDISYHLS